MRPGDAGDLSNARFLDAALDPLQISIDARQKQQLSAYVETLLQWNAVHNLTSIRTHDDIVRLHLVDCLAAIASMTLRLAEPEERPSRVLDVGSGAGLPGLIVAAMLPSVDVTCIDSVGKKTAFVRQVALSMKLTNVTALHGRVETLQATSFDLVVSRAFAALDHFVSATRHLLRPSGCWMAMKGKLPVDELSLVERGGVASVFHVEQLHVPGVHADRCLVWMRPL